MDRDELKPCPAECFHTVDRGPPSVFSRRRDIWGVYCQTCQCSTEYYSTEAEAIAAWNTRLQPSGDGGPSYSAGYAKAIEDAAKVMEDLCFFTPIEELLDMTKQEMSVRTCKEGAAAIRALAGKDEA